MDKLVTAGRYGTVSSGISVQRAGGIPALPYRKEIEEEVKQNLLSIVSPFKAVMSS